MATAGGLEGIPSNGTLPAKPNDSDAPATQGVTTHQHQNHRHHHHQHHHNKASTSTMSATYVSDGSALSRTRSTSSTTFTGLSTFPSATSRPHAADDDSAARVQQVDRTVGAQDRRDDRDHSPQDRLHQYAEHDSCPRCNTHDLLSPHAPQPHSLLASPPSCLRSRRVRGSGRGSASNSHSHSRRQSQEEERVDGDRGEEAGVHHADNDEDNGYGDAEEGIDDGAAGSLDSHVLAFDQTCLRIAYLVSTMVTPSGGSATGDAEGSALGQLPNSSTAAGASSIHSGSAGPAGPSGSAGSATLASAALALIGSAAAASGTISALHPSSELVGRFVDACPRAWSSAEPQKKRRKIAQILVWQTEVDEAGGEAYCACSVGTAVEEDAKSGAADSDGRSNGRQAAPPLPSTAGGSPSPSPVSPVLRCDGCGHLLTPIRPLDVPTHEAYADFDRPEGAFRRMFKSIYGFAYKKKRSQDDWTLRRDQKRWRDFYTRDQYNWDLWYDLNTEAIRYRNPANVDLFFPQTTMYYDYSNSGEAAPSGPEEQAASPSSSSEGGFEPRMLEERRRREMAARLLRAQQLLARTHATPEAVTDKAHPPTRDTDIANTSG